MKIKCMQGQKGQGMETKSSPCIKDRRLCGKMQPPHAHKQHLLSPSPRLGLRQEMRGTSKALKGFCDWVENFSGMLNNWPFLHFMSSFLG